MSRSDMKVIIGLGMILAGIILGAYVGFYLMFICGIIQLIHGITPVFIASDIAWGLARVLGASAVGGFVAFVLVIPGIAIIQYE